MVGPERPKSIKLGLIAVMSMLSENNRANIVEHIFIIYSMSMLVQDSTKKPYN
jgi:hypothetical protein